MIQSRLRARSFSTRTRSVWMQYAIKGRPGFSPAYSASSNENSSPRGRRLYATGAANSIVGVRQPADSGAASHSHDWVLHRWPSAPPALPNRCEVVRSMYAWWLPCACPRSNRDSCRLNAARLCHLYNSLNQQRRRISRRYVRARILIARHAHG